jgi:hypothetical protein
MYSGHRAIAAGVTKDDALSDNAGVDHIAAPGISALLVKPPVFYKNKFGVVTNRRQFQSYYELNSVRSTGPYIWARS